MARVEGRKSYEGEGQLDIKYLMDSPLRLIKCQYIYSLEKSFGSSNFLQCQTENSSF